RRPLDAEHPLVEAPALIAGRSLPRRSGLPDTLRRRLRPRTDLHAEVDARAACRDRVRGRRRRRQTARADLEPDADAAPGRGRPGPPRRSLAHALGPPDRLRSSLVSAHLREDRARRSLPAGRAAGAPEPPPCEAGADRLRGRVPAL